MSRCTPCRSRGVGSVMQVLHHFQSQCLRPCCSGVDLARARGAADAGADRSALFQSLCLLLVGRHPLPEARLGIQIGLPLLVGRLGCQVLHGR